MIDYYFTSRWVCPRCGESVMIHNETDTSRWNMCIQCEGKEAIRKAERFAFAHQQEITKHNLLVARSVAKPRYRYNWKTGKAELVRFG